MAMKGRDKTKYQLVRELERLETRSSQVKRALRESEERYRTIIGNIEDGYYEVDLAGNFTFFNDAMCRIYGYPREELLGMNNRQYTDKVNAKKVFETYNQVYTTGEPGRGFDFEIIRKDGTRRYIEVSISLRKDPAGKPTGFRGMVRDITERKRAEETLRRSEETAKRLAQENAIIAEVGRIVSSTLDIEGIYGHFAEEVKKLIPFDRIAINTVNYGSGMVTVAYVTGVDVRDRLKGMAIALAGTLAGEVVRARKGMVIQGEDPKKVTDRFPGLSASFQAGIRSLMAIPLISKDVVVGALHFHSMKRNAYREKDLRVAEEVGNQIAGAIANAQLFIERRQAEEALRQSEEKYRTILKNIEEGYYEVDLAGSFTFFNDAMCRILGYPKEELMGMNNRQYTDRENAKRLFQAFNKVYTTGEPGRGFDNELIRKDGTKRYVEASISLKKDSSGRPVGFRGIVRDITERKRFEKVLQQERETFFSILQKEPYGALLIDTNETFLYVNPEFTVITGYTTEDVPNGREWFRRAYPDPEYRHKIIATWKADIAPRKGVDRVWSVVCKNGEIKEIEFRLTFLDDGRIIAMLSDVTERKRTEEELAYRATHDLLTGLPNRMLFKDRFSVAIAQAQRVHKKLAVVFLDLDRFKEVNDTLGHHVGDRLLCAVGNRLSEFVRKTDTVARIGGDEFLLLLAEIDRVEDATAIARKVVESVQDPFVVSGRQIFVTASMGIAFYPDDGNEVDTLVNCADKVMYRVKQKGFDIVHPYPQDAHGGPSE
jgi:diguanylate cyclase (GGDEF)-like protein/PAS domain S-box-containing protein